MLVVFNYFMLFIFLGYKYETAKGFYEQGIQKLHEQKWSESKKYFQEANQNGIFFLKDGEKQYQTTIKAYGQSRLKQGLPLIKANLRI